MIRNILALLVGVVLLALGFMASMVALAIIAVLGLALGAWFWWHTRELRRTMKEQTPGGQVIDGEAIVVEEYVAKAGDVVPGDPPGQ